MKYGSFLKGKLQEICAERGLSAEGTKDVLIERLEENDKLRVELEAEDEPAVEQTEQVVAAPVETVVVAAAAAVEDSTVEPVVAAAAVVEPDTAVEAAVEPAAPVVDEEAAKEAEKKSVLEDLARRIVRARRFGDEDSAKDLEAQKTRIEKFGLQPKAPKALNAPTGPKAAGKTQKSANGVTKRRFNKYHKNNRTR